MARDFVTVGYVTSVSTTPGVFKDDKKEIRYDARIFQEQKQWKESDKVNSDLTLGHRVSIIANEYVCSHTSQIRYVIIHGVSWKVTNIVIQRPRVILTIGGVYNG
jgi:hypothetical protein